jgi:hypothetical protein
METMLSKSLFQELKLRLGVKTDDEVKKILRRLYNIKQQPDRYKETEDDKRNIAFIKEVFKSEPITWESFVRHNLEYLDFPVWLAEMVDKGELTAAQATILNEKKVVEKFSEEQLKRLAQLAKGKSVEALRRAVNELLGI